MVEVPEVLWVLFHVQFPLLVWLAVYFFFLWRDEKRRAKDYRDDYCRERSSADKWERKYNATKDHLRAHLDHLRGILSEDESEDQ